MTVPVSGRRLRDASDVCDALQLNFSEEQLAAICAPLEPGVIVAGAGTGKTTVMAARVVWLVGSGQVLPAQVLGLTFTRKAAGELASRVGDSLARAGVLAPGGDEAREVVMTYDSFASRLVAEHGLRLGLESDPVVITGASRYRLASEVVNAAPGPFRGISRLRPGSVAARVLKLDSELQSHLVSPDQVRQHAESFALRLAAAPPNNRGNPYVSITAAEATLVERLELLELVEQYRRHKARLGVTEFADQLAAAAQLVRAVGTVPELMREQFRVVLLDEYQDTSSAQALLLRGLFGEGHPVTAVGDPLQAIYGWRGAAASNIMSFARDFPRADGSAAHVFHLTTNRRSQHAILRVANDVGTTLRAEQARRGDQLAPLDAPSDVAPGRVHAIGLETVDDEIAWLAEEIADQAREVDVDWAETAVLVRRNADIPAIYAALGDRDVPVEIVGLGGLLMLPEVSVVVSTLTLLHDVGANADLATLLTGPRWRIGPADMLALGSRARALLGDVEAAHGVVDPADRLCLYDAARDPGTHGFSSEALTRLGEFVREFAMLQRHADEPVVDLTRRVIATLGLEVELNANRIEERHDPAAQVARFVDAVAEYADADLEASLGGLLDYLAAELSHGVGLEQGVPSEQNSVKLMTIHKAKGLEWDRVYLPGLADRVFPSDQPSDNYVTQAAMIPAPLRGDAAGIPQLSEVSDAGFKRYADDLKVEQRFAEDRLAYVAATRARHLLVGSWHVWAPGLARPRTPSPYYLAIEREAERDGRVLGCAPEPADANPLVASQQSAPWPAPLDEDRAAERAAAGRLVEDARARLRAGEPLTDPPLSAEAAHLVAVWDADIEALLAQAREADREVVDVVVPESVSVTGLAAMQADPDAWAAGQLRPMPRPPSSAAELGSRFHAWVQARFGALSLFDDDPESPASGSESDKAFHRLRAAFEAGPYAAREPVGIEVPFVVRLGRHTVRGRIDAVYRTAGGRFEIVDWKTSRQPADPLQLAVYRLAWAQAQGVSVDEVDAVFYHVASGEVVRPDDLPDADQLMTLLGQSR